MTVNRVARLGKALMAVGAIAMFASLCFSIAFAHISMATMILGWLICRPAIWRLPGFFCCVAFAVWVFVGAAVLYVTEDRELFHSRHGTTFIWLAMYVCAVSFADPWVRRWALYVGIATMTASVVVAAAQFFIGFGTKPPFRIDPNGPRFDSSRGFLAKHLTQGFMMTLMCLVYLGQTSAFTVTSRWTWMGRILGTTAVLLANSRSAILAFAAAVGAHLIAGWGFRMRILLGAAAVLVAVVGWIWVVTPEKITRVLELKDGRIIIWEAAAEMIERRPWFGVATKEGYLENHRIILQELYPDGSQDAWLTVPHAHNIYLGLATEHGIPALVLYMAMVAAVLRHLYRRRHENRSGWQIGCGATAALMVGGMTEHYAGLSLPSYGFFCVLGMALALDRKYLQEIGIVAVDSGVESVGGGDGASAAASAIPLLTPPAPDPVRNA